MTKLSIKKFKAALKGSYGVQSVIAKACNVERSTITIFLNKHPDMRILCEQEREKIIDIAENRLHAEANKGKKWAIKSILSSIGKGRGYVEKQEIDLGGKVTANVDMAALSLCKNYNEQPNNSTISPGKSKTK